jgi:hypothetical protein
MAWIDPLSWSKLRRRTAPRTMYRIEAAVTRPSIEAAPTWSIGTFHTRRAKRTVMMYATGMARVAGFRNRTIRTNTERMGSRASAERIPKLILINLNLQGRYRQT